MKLKLKTAKCLQISLMLNYVSFFLYFTVNHLRVSLSSNYLPSLPIQIVLILQYQSNIWTHLHFVAFLYFYYLGIAEKKIFFKYLNHKIAVYSKHKSANKKRFQHPPFDIFMHS